MHVHGFGPQAPEAIRVLHVDDEPSLVDLTEAYLEREPGDFQFTTATSANDGLERLQNERVDCVVSDYDMPGMNGIEFLEAVREDHPDLPFILFTGKGGEEVASDAISAGVTDYLQKESGTDQYTILANRIRNAVERDRSRRALAERNRRLETLVSNLPGVVYRCRNEPEWPMEFVGGECEKLTGHPAHALESGDVVWGEDVLHPDDRGTMWDLVQDALDARDPFEATYRICTRDGDVKHVWERGRGIYDDDSLQALEGFITDITDRVRRERDLERANARFEAVFEHSPDPVVIHDAGGDIVDANRQFFDSLGYDEPDLDDLTVWDVDPTLDRGEIRDQWRNMDPGERAIVNSTHQRADGTTFPAEVHVTRLDLAGEERYLAICRDVSDR